MITPVSTTLVLEKGRFYVQHIFYQKLTIRVVDASLNHGTDDDCSLPLSSVSVRFSDCGATSYRPGYLARQFSTMFLVNCTRPMKSFGYVEAIRARCSPSSSNPPNSYFYFLDVETKPPDFNESCWVIAKVPIMLQNIRGVSTSDIYKRLLLGVEMSWKDYNNTCYKLTFHDVFAGLAYALSSYVDSFVYFLFKGPHIAYNSMYPPDSTYLLCLQITGGIFIPRTFIGLICLIALVTYKWRRRHLSADDAIEEFLQTQNFIPIWYSFREIKKITRDFSDKLGEGGFGLAKLYSVGDSIVSLTAARGTIGYIAPELVYHNVGGVSNKSDVYSFGMLLLEIIGKRKNLNTSDEESSKVYFPSWVYDQFDQGVDVELAYETRDEKIMVKKMVITAFWCIQLKPDDRPSMSKVLEMLETDVEPSELPPRPFQFLLETASEGHVSESTTIDESTTSFQI